jgi:hypothetical protein
MMSAQTTFCSTMTVLFTILALRAAKFPFVVCRTLYCGLLVDMFL